MLPTLIMGWDFPGDFAGISKAPNLTCSSRYLQIQVDYSNNLEKLFCLFLNHKNSQVEVFCFVLIFIWDVK